MEKIMLCNGGCGNKAKYSGWCEIRWRKENRISVKCPKAEEKRGKAISKYRIKESKLGLNPMQNPLICKKNHSIERNKKASESLKKLGELKLLPQQIESKYKSRLRLLRIRKALQKLAAEGKLNHQIESLEEKKLRHKKISETVKELHAKGIYKNNIPKKIKYKSKVNGKIYLRSKWELDVAKFLDKNNISWLYEPFPVPYLDNNKEKHVTIPDFYLPKYNLIIEVKGLRKDFISSYTINNKIEGIKKAGFKFYLWMEKEIQMIRKNNTNLLLNSIKILENKNNA
ncbi:MAG TPA: hypothetical protein VJI68_02290 [Candidatus Nanoarchaeia archaeon]|nr:hypothetical protein [Candidatus Nanoarchaeia archaeon]